MRLAVVGTGLAALALSDAADQRGHTVITIGDGAPPGSTAAVALLRATYLGDKRRLLEPSLRWWSDRESEVLRGAEVSRWDRAGSVSQKDWVAIEPIERMEPTVFGWAEAVDDSTVRVDGELLEADKVVWCDAEGEGKETFGVTWVHPSPDALSNQFMVHHLAPYKNMAGVSYSTGCRIGSASNTDLAKAISQSKKMFFAATELGWITEMEGWTQISGRRLQRPETFTTKPYRWSGFHRTGYGVIPAEASTVLDTLELL